MMFVLPVDLIFCLAFSGSGEAEFGSYEFVLNLFVSNSRLPLLKMNKVRRSSMQD